MLIGPPSILRRLVWLLLTGDFRSPLRHIPDGQPFRLIRTGPRFDVQAIPTQVDPIKKKFFPPKTRVRVRGDSGFHRGARGTVSYHAPDDRVWVLRDGAGSDVFFYPYELEELEECPSEST
ncbi:hypothetical protein P9A48_gp71 [Xanthomonas phage Mallos]|uniref:Uncharacterized protein n=1 Tax=Xanthomonas phage Mallos TaxID=2939131 RepID=A0A9E7E278_9CAUD|nr:hypothetical protein P9A48_gp71 [Xanthomonas phage Mallos]URA07179.1 hypothetical protein Mallos_BL60071 [Xanthomonas phage Mallos]